jgi:hypothetical protein
MKLIVRLLTKFWYFITRKDYSVRLEYAGILFDNIIASTDARSNHFRNIQGEKIRGYYNSTIVRKELHPLIVKYGS